MKHQAADALLRLLINETEITLLEDNLLFLKIRTLKGSDKVIILVVAIKDAIGLLDATNISMDKLHSAADIPLTGTVDGFIREQVKDAYCHTIKSQVRQPKKKFHNDHHELLL